MSDQDARPTGSSHPFAHLWDNGSNAADELDRVMQIRKVALANFGEKNIRSGSPMATLEEVLVPMYFFHRYQLEATAKMIGGLNYRYALRGDGQPITEFVQPGQQEKALQSLIKTISPENLALSESLMKIIPPRPIGYVRSREVVKIRTDLTFDGLSPAESAADMTIGLILNPARAQRLIEYHSRDNNQPSLESVVDKLIAATIKAEKKSGYPKAVQFIVDDVLVSNLFRLAAGKETSGLVKSTVYSRLDQVKNTLADGLKTSSDIDWKSHARYLIMRIDKFRDDPTEYIPETILTPPPGQPIGSTLNSCDF